MTARATSMPLAVWTFFRCADVPKRTASIGLGWVEKQSIPREPASDIWTHIDSDWKFVAALGRTAMYSTAACRRHTDDSEDCVLQQRCRLVRCIWRTAMDQVHCPAAHQTCSQLTVVLIAYSDVLFPVRHKRLDPAESGALNAEITTSTIEKDGVIDSVERG